MNAKKIWAVCALTVLALLATASIGSSEQLKVPAGPAADAGSTLGETGMPLCSGDGSSGKCGGIAPGIESRGCENTQGLGGALLRGCGSARLCQDNPVLEASCLPVPTTVLIVESMDAVTHGMGTPFGDGLMCLSRNTHRVAVRQPRRYGMASYPAIPDLPFSIVGKVSALQPTRCYQAMYRDP